MIVDYEWLAGVYKSLDYRWSINGERQVPTAEDLRQAIDKLGKELYARNSDMIEMGRLMVLKDGKHHDVYLHVGEANDPSTVHEQG